jgi:nucleoside-diphosphate-sugar epimerase
MLQDRKILVTGATGQIAGPIAENFAKDNEVWVCGAFQRSEPQGGTRGIRRQDLPVGHGLGRRLHASG